VPRKSFFDLPLERRQRLFDAAAEEIIAAGLDKASMNRILSRAGLSKGVAYHYFDNRNDLLASVLRDRLEPTLAGIDFDVDALTADGFWDELVQAGWALAQGWFLDDGVLTILRALWALPPDVRQQGALGTLWEEFTTLTTRILRRGQALGCVRTDLPEGLLVAMTFGIGQACDLWFLEHADDMTPDEHQQFNVKIFTLFQDLLRPRMPH